MGLDNYLVKITTEDVQLPNVPRITGMFGSDETNNWIRGKCYDSLFEYLTSQTLYLDYEGEDLLDVLNLIQINVEKGELEKIEYPFGDYELSRNDVENFIAWMMAIKQVMEENPDTTYRLVAWY